MLSIFEDEVIDQIYAYEMLQKFAFSLIGIFIPIYILSQNGQVELAFLYLIGYTSVFLLSALPVSYVIARIGFKHSLLISYLFYLPAFLAVRSYSLDTWLVTSVAVFVGLGKAFHWIALNSEFAVDSSGGSRGKASGRLLGLPRISKAVAPFLGGLIMAYYGFPMLAVVAFFFMLASAYPLFASKDHRDPLDYDLRKLLTRKYAVFASFFFLRGMTIASGALLFPIYIFFVLGGTVNAGSVGSLANFGSVAFALFIGRVSDRLERRHMMIIGALASSAFFVLRAYVDASLEAFVLSFVAGLMFMAYYVPLYSFLADTAEDEEVLEFYAFRELTLGIGKVFAFGLALFLYWSYGIVSALRITFMLTALAVLLVAFYTRLLDI
ncbi:MAG: MFS transporter [Candidatus Nanohaloarchaea archaeon]